MRLLTRWHGWAVFALGLWLAVSPWLTGYSDHAVATANAAGVGLLLALAAHLEASCELSIEWLDLGGGVWLLIAPFVLGFDHLSVAAAHCIAVGAAASALAASSLHLERQPVRR